MDLGDFVIKRLERRVSMILITGATSENGSEPGDGTGSATGGADAGGWEEKEP
jgi:hypothetical protein